MKRLLSRWLPPLLWAGGIFGVSSRSTLPHVSGLLGWDKLQHGLAYALGGALLARALAGHPRAATLALALGTLYALSDELHQALVPGRSPDVRDWVADAVGVLAGILFHHLLLQLLARRDARGAQRGAHAIST